MADQVHAHVGQDVGDHERVHHVGLAGIARLAFVIFGGEAEGFLDRGEVVLGAVFADLGFQFEEELLDRVRRRRYGDGCGEALAFRGSLIQL